MRSDQAKEIHMRDLLDALGYQPFREQKGELWYLSPFRQETDASFKITRDGGGWYDHGEGAGGNILDFVMRYHKVDFRGALQTLDDLNIHRNVKVGDRDSQSAFWDAAPAPVDARTAPKPSARVTDSDIVVTRVQPLQNRALLAYLKKRGIDAEIAAGYVQEIYYTQKGNPYFALAFANECGGYELRNPYFKGTYGNKDMTIIKTGQGGKRSVALFEGFMDFLSACMIARRTPAMDCIILNSTAMRDRAIETIEQMGVDTVHLYLDRDKSGRQLTQDLAEQLSGLTVKDESGMYEEFKDLNEYLMDRSKTLSPAR